MSDKSNDLKEVHRNRFSHAKRELATYVLKRDSAILDVM